MPFVLIGMYCGVRALWYKLYRLLVGRERLDADPELLKARVVFDLLRIFPPVAWTEQKKKKWESVCWIYGVVSILLLAVVIFI